MPSWPSSAASSPTAGAHATSVLAVDDDAISLEIISAALRAAGHSVTALSDPLEFWDALERARPDLVVLDVQMPGADGIELCRALRADPHWRGVPVLFLTATTSSGAVAELFAAGADDYVPKPVHAGRAGRARRQPPGADGAGARGRAARRDHRAAAARGGRAPARVAALARGPAAGRSSPSPRSRSTASTRSTTPPASAGWRWRAGRPDACCAPATSAPSGARGSSCSG